MSSRWLRSKTVGGAIGIITGLATVVGGIGLIHAGSAESQCDIAIAGGILIEAGISAMVNAVQQCFCDDQEEFNYSQLGLNVGIGCVSLSLSLLFRTIIWGEPEQAPHEPTYVIP